MNSTPPKARRTVMCQYAGCENPATVRICEANMNCCEDHCFLNLLKFGYSFTTEKLRTKLAPSARTGYGRGNLQLRELGI